LETESEIGLFEVQEQIKKKVTNIDI